jgi:hypothetical protein
LAVENVLLGSTDEYNIHCKDLQSSSWNQWQFTRIELICTLNSSWSISSNTITNAYNLRSYIGWEYLTIVKVQLYSTDEYESLLWFVWSKSGKMSRIELRYSTYNNSRSMSSITITNAYNLRSYIGWEYLTIAKVQLYSTDEYESLLWFVWSKSGKISRIELR